MYLDEFKHQLPDIDEAGDDRLDPLARRRRRPGGRDPRPLPPVQAPQAGAPAPGRAAAAHQHPLHQHDLPGAGAGLPGRRGASSGGSAGSSAGTRSRWSCAPTRSTPASAATSPRMRARPRCTRSASTGSSRAATTAAPATRSSTRATPRRASTPGRSSRAALNEEQLDHFRRETPPQQRPVSSYPHPRLMPDFWEFPTVSMGLGPIDAIYQARFNRYLQNRGLARHVRQPRLGVPRRRRDRRARGARRAPRRRRRGPRQPDLRRQLQPAAPRRPGSRQRQDHPGARGGLPRLGLERDQGHLGPRVGRAPRARRRRRARREDEHHRRRRVPEVLGRRRRVHPRALLRARIRGSGSSSST